MPKLIALVAIHTRVEGERIVIAPGEEVRGLPQIEVDELKASGSLKDSDEEAAAEKAENKATTQAGAAFKAEKKREQERQAAAAAAAAAAGQPS